jgi:hypothetical protein
MKKILTILFVLLIVSANSLAQGNSNQIETNIKSALAKIDWQQTGITSAPKLLSYEANADMESITIKLDDSLAKGKFDTKTAEKISKQIRKGIPSSYKKYDLIIISDGKTLNDIAEDSQAGNQKTKYNWESTDYKGNPWVQNVSKPIKITKGLQDRHISIWASHGRYYDIGKGRWQWQRPNLFGTTEDLYSQTVVIPYLIPMLQNAGAVVFSPRERDWQKQEVIVDNDGVHRGYIEYGSKHWTSTSTQGFAVHAGNYSDGENPFTKGTARKVKTTKGKNVTMASYQPTFPESGDYAVYVSYQTVKKSIGDAEYVVYHKGQATTFHVNQQMGSGTWVYLGTFNFDKGSSEFNRVVVTNHSDSKGVVTTDAVRFGGGMGNIERGGEISGLPRCLEGARYSTQWYGAPREVVSIFQGQNDYNDDINCRSLMMNWLAGGSPYVPYQQGLKVPIELSLAVHSDAGYTKDGSLTGTLGICTTDYKGDTRLNSGLSRSVSKDFAQGIVDQIKNDLQSKFNISWSTRGVWDKNYNESRRPEVPSAILEMLSHQNFNDMKFGQDPNFKFTLARAAYKEITKYIASLHNTTYVIQPLAPDHFCTRFISKGKLQLSWQPVYDKLESSAQPTSYIVYTAINNGGFDNGTVVNSTNYTIDLEPGSLYRFRVAAINAGGESFPTEELAAEYNKDASKNVLIVNNFHRLSSPAIIDNDLEQGFDFNTDPGVPYGKYAGWNGFQTNFDKTMMGKEGSSALGFGGDELAGTFIMGNTFDYTTEHARAISSAKKYNIVSCSVDAVEIGSVNLADYNAVDLIEGLEENDGHSLVAYKSFSTTLQQKILDYLNGHGRLFVSGAYIGSDMTSDGEKTFLANALKVNYNGQNRDQINTVVTGMGTQMDVWRAINEQHYAAVSADVLNAVGQGYCAMKYADGTSAAVAYDGTDYKTFTMGFPVECIKDVNTRRAVIKGIIAFILK